VYIIYNKLGVMKYKKFLLLFISFFGLVLLGGEVSAQDVSGIKVQPSLIEERVDPGDTYLSTLQITNLSSQEHTFYIVKRDISGLSPEGQPIFAGDQEVTGYEVSSWIDISDVPIVLKSNESKKIPFSIVVPEDAGPGGHFGGIFFSLQGERPEEIGTGVGFQVGSIINLKISGDITEELQIREFATDKNIYGFPKVLFTTRIKNLGNILVRPRGLLEIVNFWGDEVAVLRINDSGAAVFPDSIKQFESTWEGSKFSFGRYQAILSFVYGDEVSRTVFSSISFWVLPLNIILPVGGGLALFLLIIVLSIKIYVRRKVKEIQRTTESISQGKRTWAGQNIMQHSKKGGAFSKLTFIAASLLMFTIIFLLILFFLFA